MKNFLLSMLMLFTCLLLNAQQPNQKVQQTSKSGHLPYPPIQTNVNSYSFGYFGSEQKLVKLDPWTRIPLSDIPMDRNFYMRIYFNSGSSRPTHILLLDGNKTTPQSPQIGWVNADSSVTDDDKFLQVFDCAILVMPPLKPNHRYSLVLTYPAEAGTGFTSYKRVLYMMFKNIKSAHHEYIRYEFPFTSISYTKYKTLKAFYNQKNIGKIFENAKTHAGVNSSDEQILSTADADLTKVMTDNSTNFIRIGSTTQTVFFNASVASNLNPLPYKIESSAPFSLVADAGVIYSGFQKGFSVVSPYVGICYSFRPFDSDLKFQEVKKEGLSLFERLSFNLGLTLNSFAKTNYRGDILGSNNIMCGLGYRLSNVAVITTGGVFYNNVDPNPLLAHKTVGFAPYVGLSINLKIKTALGDVVKVFSYGK